MIGGDGGILWFFILAAAVIYPLYRMLPKYGFNPMWSLAAVLPVGLVILLWVMAFAEEKS